ncbi:hypothetical protein SLEP1_g46858 [Rubroshorea leprosula]|uniref:Uncharacterized protein n=1 Tax=Rubroshorea leprosula TaxID=152421 RepID=A0AAV5LR43_9ROSI|nr:hypothetical protein SLEP1_g46858 [Rubroshorea leprosula]
MMMVSGSIAFSIGRDGRNKGGSDTRDNKMVLETGRQP